MDNQETDHQEAPNGRIAASEFLEEQEARDVSAAIKRLGTNAKAVASYYDLNYDNIRKVLNRTRPCWPRYARVFNELLDKADLLDQAELSDA
jgi:hypothetical protein